MSEAVSTQVNPITAVPKMANAVHNANKKSINSLSKGLFTIDDAAKMLHQRILIKRSRFRKNDGKLLFRLRKGSGRVFGEKFSESVSFGPCFGGFFKIKFSALIYARLNLPVS